MNFPVLSKTEFVLLMAAPTMVEAFAGDIMLPAAMARRRLFLDPAGGS